MLENVPGRLLNVVEQVALEAIMTSFFNDYGDDTSVRVSLTHLASQDLVLRDVHSTRRTRLQRNEVVANDERMLQQQQEEEEEEEEEEVEAEGGLEDEPERDDGGDDGGGDDEGGGEDDADEGCNEDDEMSIKDDDDRDIQYTFLDSQPFLEFKRYTLMTIFVLVGKHRLKTKASAKQAQR